MHRELSINVITVGSPYIAFEVSVYLSAQVQPSVRAPVGPRFSTDSNETATAGKPGFCIQDKYLFTHVHQDQYSGV